MFRSLPPAADAALGYLRGDCRRLLGLTLREDDDGCVYAWAVELHRRGRQVQLREASKAGAPLREIASAYGGWPTHVAIAASPALVTRTQGATSDVLVHETLPGMKAAALITSHLRLGRGTRTYLLRRPELERLLAEVRAVGLRPAGVSLGLSALGGVPGALTPGRFADDGGAIAIDASGDCTWEPGDPGPAVRTASPKIGDDEVAVATLPGVVGGLADLVGAATLPEATALWSRRRERSQVRRWLALGMGVLLVTLAASLAVRARAGAQVEQSLAAGFAQRQRTERDEAARALATERRELALELGIGTATETGRFADGIASVMPDGVYLESLEVFPEDDRANRATGRTALRYVADEIRLTGGAAGAADYAEMQRALRELTFVKTVEHVSFGERPDGGITFEVQVIVNVD